jgi:hypothetical protein
MPRYANGMYMPGTTVRISKHQKNFLGSEVQPEETGRIVKALPREREEGSRRTYIVVVDVTAWHISEHHLSEEA